MSDIKPGPQNLITDVAGLKVGQAEDHSAITGATVVLCDHAMTAAVDVRGGGPGTSDTDALNPTCLIDGVHGIVLSGGSVFGLAAADGARSWLSSQGVGLMLAASPHAIPILPSAILFDLTNGGDKSWRDNPPYHRLGRTAAQSAGHHFELGNAGAGLGAVAGVLKGGTGSASAQWSGFCVGALVVVNPVGSTIDPRTGDLWARPYELADEFGPPPVRAPNPGPLPLRDGTKLVLNPEGAANTTIAVIAVSAALDKGETQRLAIMASDGMARAIRPIHTSFDGDTVFALATGERALTGVRAATLSLLGTLAADCLTRAIGRAMAAAASIPQFPAWRSRAQR